MSGQRRGKFEEGSKAQKERGVEALRVHHMNVTKRQNIGISRPSGGGIGRHESDKKNVQVRTEKGKKGKPRPSLRHPV